MNRQRLIKEIRKIAEANGTTARITRQGKHEIWECDGLIFPLPRHTEISEGTAHSVLSRLTDHLENR